MDPSRQITRPGPCLPTSQGRDGAEERSRLGGGSPTGGPAAARPGVGASPAGDEPPWERPGAVPRDCQAHRAHLLLALADASLLLGTLSLCQGSRPWQRSPAARWPGG